MNITQHSSPLVRIEAIKAFLRRCPVNIVKVFSFIDDPNDSIRHLILTYLGREKNEEAEKALSAYLEKNITGKSEKKYIRECYQALGSCGSNRSIPFLQNILMHPGWLPTRNRTLNRHGAAAALAAIGTHEALSVLETAGKSLNLGIRQAARQAIRGLKEIK
jgi:HEAT repeat protein